MARRAAGFFETAGDRWWPIAGGVYFLRATKKVLGMRVITPAWERRKNGLATAPRQARECIERDGCRRMSAGTCRSGPRARLRGDARVGRDLHRRRMQGQSRPRWLGRAAGAAARRKELFGGERATTNNRMELTAVIRALESLTRGCDVDLYTDSQYVKNGIEIVDSRLEAQRLEDERPEAGQERRAVARTRRIGDAARHP